MTLTPTSGYELQPPSGDTRRRHFSLWTQEEKAPRGGGVGRRSEKQKKKPGGVGLKSGKMRKKPGGEAGLGLKAGK